MAVTFRRGASPELIAELSKPFFYPTLLLAIEWPDGTRRVHSGKGTLSFGGQDHVGVGELGGLTVPQESGGTARRAVLDLIAPPGTSDLDIEALFSEADADVRGNAVTIWIGAVTTAAGTVISGAPVQSFTGLIDAMKFPARTTGEGQVHLMRLEVSTGPSATASTPPLHSYEDQIAAFPGDTAGRHLITAESTAGQLTRG